MTGRFWMGSSLIQYTISVCLFSTLSLTWSDNLIHLKCGASVIQVSHQHVPTECGCFCVSVAFPTGVWGVSTPFPGSCLDLSLINSGYRSRSTAWVYRGWYVSVCWWYMLPVVYFKIKRPLISFKQIYISCLLKAVSASAPVTIENKACSFYEGYENVFEDLSFIDSFERTFMTLTLPTVCGWL